MNQVNRFFVHIEARKAMFTTFIDQTMRHEITNFLVYLTQKCQNTDMIHCNPIGLTCECSSPKYIIMVNNFDRMCILNRNSLLIIHIKTFRIIETNYFFGKFKQDRLKVLLEKV